MCLAVPGKIVSIVSGDILSRQGRIDFGGIIREASLACVPDAIVGDYVLVHAGVAIGRIDESEAQRTLDLLREMMSAEQEGDREAY